jgi:hypothetical protein
MRKILIGIGVIALVVGFMWAGREWNSLQVSARNAKYNDEVDNIFTALQKYKERAGAYPTGGNIEVVKTLQGNNAKNVIVIVGPKTPLNDRGEFIDPWGTSLKIYFSDNGILIRSAGPNRRFDDTGVMNADDIFRSN